MSILKDITIEKAITRHAHEHETFISWNNDCQNIAFQDWLCSEGLLNFEKWYEKNKGNYE